MALGCGREEHVCTGLRTDDVRCTTDERGKVQLARAIVLSKTRADTAYHVSHITLFPYARPNTT